jgi:predicted component of type VI protein secretion system
MKAVVPIARESALTPDQSRSLRSLVGMMIPASAEHAVPGADDDAIFADILASLGRDAPRVRQALQRLDELCDGVFADAPADARGAAVQDLRDRSPTLAAALVDATVRCYYRDDRVMRSLGMAPRPPFPEGYEVESGDWSLLDPVRARPKMYRDAP